jgi:uroporphyrinogen decarboxylase
MNDLFLRACRREPVERVPVWMMRQAGRYLPEYRKVRERADFLTMVGTPELAVEVTLQPVERLGVDAAIIFSDILVIPQAMGMTLSVDEGVGPRFHDPLRSPDDVARLRDPEPEHDLRYMLEAVRLARRELEGRVPLIGFAGAPWTLMSYMIEGGGSKSFSKAKRFLLESPEVAHRLLERDFREFALPYLADAVRAARAAGVPVIAFAPGAGWALEEIADTTEADVIGVDWQTDAADARRRIGPDRAALQGNLDPCWLYARPEVIRERTEAMLGAFGGRGHIANLGHGILPDVPVEHASAFVEAVRAWRPA